MFTRLMLISAAVGILLCGQQQQLATLRGIVTDPSGKAVPGVSVNVKAESGGQLVRAVSDQRGEFSAAGLPAGVYSMSGEVAGFQRFEREGVQLAAGQVTALSITLEILVLESNVTVVSKAPLLEGEKETQTRNHQEVLEIREVRESSSKDVGEALSRLDGLWKVRRGGISNDVVLRGFQQDNISILIDGVRIYGACPNNMDPAASHVDFAEVQRVDLSKGPFDIKNQGSLGGTINIVNKTPEAGFEFTPSVSVGSFGYINPSAVASFSTDRFHFVAGNSYRQSNLYKDGTGKPVAQWANYNQAGLTRNAFDINTSWFRVGVSPRKNHNVGLAYTRQQGGLILYPSLTMDAPYDNADRFNGSYNISELNGPIRQIRMRGYFTQVKHWMTDEFRVSSAGLALPYSMGSFAGTKALGGRLETDLAGFVVGVEGYRRNWNTVNTMRMSGQYVSQAGIPNVYTNSAGAFGEYSRTFRQRLHLTAGVRLDTARSEATSSGMNPDLYWAYKGTRSTSQRDTNPSGNVHASYTLVDGLDLFAGVGRSVRLPDPQERYIAVKRMGSDWVGNPTLAPTKNTEVDLGFNYRTRHFTLRPTLFYSDLDDYIVVHNQPKINSVMSIMNPSARSYAGVPAKIRGGEMSYSISPFRSLLLSGGVSYSRGTKDAQPAIGILTRNLAEMPPLRSRAALRYGNRLFFVELENISTLAQGKVDTDLRELRTAGYAIWNVKAGIHTSKLKIAAGVDNLANRFYFETFSYLRDPFRLGTKIPEPGRSLYLTAIYAF